MVAFGVKHQGETFSHVRRKFVGSTAQDISVFNKRGEQASQPRVGACHDHLGQAWVSTDAGHLVTQRRGVARFVQGIKGLQKRHRSGPIGTGRSIKKGHSAWIGETPAGQIKHKIRKFYLGDSGRKIRQP